MIRRERENRLGMLAQIERVFGGQSTTGMSEADLLARFAKDGDESAFNALVTRHGPMVLGVCRRLLRDVHDVEDAFQATFFVLARRAGAIRQRELVAPWLHGVAHRVAVRARAKGAARNARELALEFAPEGSAQGDASPSESLIAKELRGLLDDELARLPTTLRKPLILCYLDGMTHDEAAAELRWPVGTVRSRMARGRDLLRNRLAKHGEFVSSTLLVGQITREIVPRSLQEITLGAVLGFQTGRLSVSASAAVLAKGVLGYMTFQKVLIVGAVVFAGTISVAGATSYSYGFGPFEQEAGEAPPTAKSKAAASNGSNDQKLERLQQENIALKAELDALKQEAAPQPTPPSDEDRAGATMQGMMGTMGEGGGGGSMGGRGMMGRDGMTGMGGMGGGGMGMMGGSGLQPGEKSLYFVRNPSTIWTVSPEGNRVTAYDFADHKSSVIEFGEGLRAIPVVNNNQTITAIGFNSIDDRAGRVPSVKKPAVYQSRYKTDRDQRLGWNVHELKTPYEGSVDPLMLSEGVLYPLGDRMLAYSSATEKWSEKTISVDPQSPPFVNGECFMIQAKGHLHIFNTVDGTWIDINSRSDEADPKAP